MSNKYPTTWVKANLPDVAYFQEGPGLRKLQFREEGIPFLNIQTLSNERVNKEKCKFLDPEEVESKYKHFLLETNDIICSSSGTLGKTAIVREEDKPLMLNTSVIRFRPHVQNLFSRGYLHIFLKSQNFLRQALNASSGSAQLNFGPTHLIKFTIPVPPLNEQHRIVAKIEELFSELDKGIENLKTARAQLKVYRQALLKHAFEGKLTAQWRAERNATSNKPVIPAQAGIQLLNDMDSRLRGNDEIRGGNDEPLETAAALLKRIQQERAQRYQQQLADWQANGGSKPKAPKPLPPLTAAELAKLPELPEGWGWVKVGNVGSVGTGITPLKGRSDFYANGNIPWVTSGALNDNFVTEASDYVTDLALKETNLRIYPKHTLLIALYGEGKTRGKCSELLIEATTNQAIAAIVQEGMSEELRKYMKWFFQKNYGDIRLKSSGGVQPNLNLSIIENTLFPMCSIEEAHQVVDAIETKLSEVDQLELTITTSLQQAEALRQSILKKAFSGQLVPQDPHDEPASELLNRIRGAMNRAPTARIKAENMRHTEKSKKSISRGMQNE